MFCPQLSSLTALSSVASFTGVKRKTQAQMNARQYKHFQAFVHFMMFTHLTYTKTFVGFFKCETLADGNQYLLGSDQVVCWTGSQWLDALPYAITGLVVLVFGLPLWYCYICWAGRRRGFQFGTTDRSFFVRKMIKFTGEMEGVFILPPSPPPPPPPPSHISDV